MKGEILKIWGIFSFAWVNLKNMPFNFQLFFSTLIINWDVKSSLTFFSIRKKTGEFYQFIFWNRTNEKHLHYSGFCRCFESVRTADICRLAFFCLRFQKNKVVHFTNLFIWNRRKKTWIIRCASWKVERDNVYARSFYRNPEYLQETIWLTVSLLKKCFV